MRKFLLALTLALVLPANAFAAFGYYKSVTIDHTQVGGSNLTDFPVTIYVTDADLKTVGNGGYVQNSSGYDIRPYSDNTCSTAITAYELVKYTASTGELELHTKIGTVSSSVDSVYYLCFGDSGISTDGSSNTTWDSSFKAVYHLNSLSVDSTSNANTLTNTSSVGSTTGLIDGASVHTGGGDKVLWKSAPVTTATNDFLITQWVKLSATTDAQSYFSNGDVNTGVAILNFSGTFQGLHNGVAFVDTGVAVDTALHHFAMRRTSGGSTQMYVDGSAAGSASGASVNTPATTFSIGATLTNASPTTTRQSTATYIDETRVSSSARTAGWITAEYNNQKTSSTFLTFGSRTSLGGGGGSAPPQLLLLGVK